MTIVCIEGPSAVGKTSVAAALAQRGAAVIPEVNELFARPEVEPSTWYLERQVDRWRLALEKEASGRLVVLDGDPFQPLWYSWAYGFEGLQTLDALVAFYAPRIASGELCFPDRYFVLHATANVLRARKEADATRGRRNFEKHLALVEPQQRYFAHMQRQAPSQVAFIDAGGTDRVADLVQCGADASKRRFSANLFEQVTRWLASARA